MSRRRYEDSDRPLIAAAAEADNELAGLLRTVERACFALGFEPGGKHERIAVAIAQCGGLTQKPMHATIARVASDRQVQCSTQWVGACLPELAEYGVIRMEEAEEPPTRRRRKPGKPPKHYALSICWEFVRETVAEYDRWESNRRQQKTAETDLVASHTELRKSNESQTKVEPKSNESQTKVEPKSNEIRASYTSSPPNNLKTYGPPSSSPAIADEDHRNLGRETVQRPTVEAAAIAPHVGNVAAAIGYRGDNGSTLWLAVAAVHCGILSEHALGDAVQATRCDPRRNPVGYFRTVLADAEGLTMGELTAELSRVRVTPRLPNAPPRASPRRPPARDPSPASDASANEARNAIQSQLAALTQ